QRKSLQAVRVGENNTVITEMDIEDAVMARYLIAVHALQAFHGAGEGEPLNVIQQIRPVLEGHCRRVCPGQFETRALGEIVGDVRAFNAEHALKAVVDDLKELNDYCRRYHHGDNAHAAEEPIDDTELSGYVR